MWRSVLVPVLAALLTGGLSAASSAMTLLTEEEALKEMFPDADTVVSEMKILDPAEVDALNDRIGGRLVLYQKGSKSEKLAEKDDYTFYFGIKDGKKTGVAVMDTQPGKWGPVQFIIALDMEGKVKDLAVMMYVEKRGRPIARRSFLGQFIGKCSEDKITVRKDIKGVSGATISSRCAAFTVRKIIALYENIYLNAGQTSAEEGVTTSEEGEISQGKESQEE